MPINRRMHNYDYCNPGGYFITTNSWHRLDTFSQIVNGGITLFDLGKIIAACWQELPKHFKNIDLGIFAIMPNHFHGILIINYSLVGSKHASNLPIIMQEQTYSSHSPEIINKVSGTKTGSLSAIIQSFKSASTRLIHKNMNTSAPVWQRSFFDHIIRDEFELGKIHDYIFNNPFQWPGEPDLLN